MTKKPKRTPYWTRVIEQAKARKKAGKQAFTYGQDVKAGDFVTCACGRQDKRIPRFRMGEPQDGFLSDLGCDFARAVSDNDPDYAGRLLLKIERRAAEVLADLR